MESGSASIIELLIEYGSDVNHFNKSRVYPLHSSCTNGSLEIVQKLVKVIFSRILALVMLMSRARFDFGLAWLENFWLEMARAMKILARTHHYDGVIMSLIRI